MEADSLLVYQDPQGVQLVDSVTVAFAASSGGRLTVANLMTGEGWRIDDGGRSGPGEFGGRMPWFSATDSVIQVATQVGTSVTLGVDGTVSETRRFSTDPLAGSEGAVFPIGVLRSRTLVSRLVAWPNGEERAYAQSLRAISPVDGERWRYEELPKVRPRTDNEAGSGVVAADARHGIVALAEAGGSWVRVLDQEGSEAASQEASGPVSSLFIDATRRIWVQTVRRGEEGVPHQVYDVFDPDLTPLGSVRLNNVLDAWNDQVVTVSIDDLGVRRLHLLRGPVPGSSAAPANP